MRITTKYKPRWVKAAMPLLWGSAGMSLFLAVILLIPSILVKEFDEGWRPEALLNMQPKEGLAAPDKPILVPVYLTKEQTTVEMTLEEYVRGVIAAEMPAEFELEALKAQAIAARTYIIRRMKLQNYEDMPEEAGDAIVTDTVSHQVFATEADLRERWGWLAFARNMDKMTRAVNETAGLILTYEGEPIEATFFSASNGFTENSEDYWQAEIPYLRSVSSPWDRMYAPNFERETAFSFAELYKQLGLPVSSQAPKMTIIKKSDSGRVLEAEIEGKPFTGREIREMLDLPSTDFTWEISGGTVTFLTRGYGHGVGMSQWGANGMAKEGRTAKEILQHYYIGVKLEEIQK